MNSLSRSSSILILIILSAVIYFIGLRTGEYFSYQNQMLLCDLQKELLIKAKEIENSHVAMNGFEQKNDINTDCTPITETTITSEIKKNVCIPAYDQRKNLSVLHIGKATVPEDVFSFLHHPSSPSKWSYFFTHEEVEQLPKKKWNQVLKSPCNEIYLTRTGSRSSQPNKCVAVTFVPNGSESIVQQSHRVGYTALNTNQYQQDYPEDYHKKENIEYLLLLPLLQKLEHLKEQFLMKMGNPIDSVTGKRRVAIVMVANIGVMDLLLNFMCSAESAGIDISSIVVFIGEERHAALVENMGAKAIYHPALGSMPPHAAQGYLDDTFARMMWFKTTSVYLALVCGFEVLFQDVDLVWLKDPFPYFEQLNHDILFMDDGARTPRYTPFFVNSGFYFVKYNDRTLYMFEKMMKAGASEIGQTHSHQSVLIRHIAESHHLFGLKVYVLDTKLFPSGQTYHENKRQVKKIQDRTFRPYVFHMCWTSNRVDKVVYFKDIGLWYLPNAIIQKTTSVYNMIRSRTSGVGASNNHNTDVCNNGDHMLEYAIAYGRTKSIRDRCCQREKYWPKEIVN